MASQNINFYKKITADKNFSESPFTWKYFIICNIIILAFYSLVTIKDYYRVSKLSTIGQTKLAEIVQLQTLVSKLKNKYPESFFTQDPNISLKEISDNINKQTKILSSLGNRIYFSKAMQAIGEVMTKNVWLTEIKILKNGEVISLMGYSLKMNDFNVFIKNILNTKLFPDYRLNIDHIDTTAKEENAPLNFSINIQKKSP